MDVWYEVLVRVDPSVIFNCIRVCKGWLEEITSPGFRQSYRKRWKNNSDSKPPVGFMKHKHGEFELLATSELGRTMNANRSMQLPGDFFISQSGEGDGLILYGSLSQNKLFVYQDGEIRPIPRPPGGFSHGGGNIAILSQQQNSYKIIRGINESYGMVVIQTFSSSTAQWEVSEPLTSLTTFPDGFSCDGPGIVSSRRGIVYWPKNVEEDDSTASYDSNDGRIGRIDYGGSSCFYGFHYGLSPRGYLQCAVSSGDSVAVWGAEQGFGVVISEFDDENKVWKNWHSVDTIPQGAGVSFVSLVPGRSDCIFVESAGQLSLYNLYTHELHTLCPLSDERWADVSKEDLVPLTMADLGVWPSSPFHDAHDTPKSNIDTVKRLLAWDH